MGKKEIFAKKLTSVSYITEVEENEIISKSRKEDIVDARYLLVYLLYEEGIYPCHIAEMINCSKRNINSIISSFKSRLSTRKLLRINYERLKNYNG